MFYLLITLIFVLYLIYSCYIFNFYVDTFLLFQEYYEVLGDATLNFLAFCLPYTQNPKYCYVHIKGSITM